MHHYHPALLPLELVKFETSVALQEAAEQRQEQKKTGEDEADASMDWAKSGEGLFPGGEILKTFEIRLNLILLAPELAFVCSIFEKLSVKSYLVILLLVTYF